MSYEYFVALAATKVIPSGIYLARTQSLSRPGKIIGILMILGLLKEILSVVLAYQGSNVALVLPYNALEVILYTCFFASVLNDRRKTIIALGAMVICAITLDSLAFLDASVNSISYAIVCVFLAGLCVLLLYKMAVHQVEDVPFTGIYIITGATLFYYSSSLIYLVSYRYIDMSNLMFLATIHAFTNAFVNVMIAWGLWKS